MSRHSQPTYDRARQRVRETGATIPTTPVRTTAAGCEWVKPTKIEKTLAVQAETFEAIADAEASGEFITSADRDALIAAYVSAAFAHVEAANEWADEVNAKRPDAEAMGAELVAEGKAELLDLLDRADEAAFKIGRGLAIRAVARNNDPAARTEHPLSVRPVADSALADVRRAVYDVDLPAARYLRQDQFRKWHSGQPATDVNGEAVPADFPAKCVKLTHAPAPGPLVAVTARGGVV
jgi:hypothetical protein